MVGEILFSDIRIEKIAENDLDKLHYFSCGNEILDNFFHEEFFICDVCHMFSGYCVKYENKIIAAFTLANDSLFIENEDKKDVLSALGGSSPLVNEPVYEKYFDILETFPAINIGHFAVQKEYQSHRIGDYILQFLRYTFYSYTVSGCLFITVDSLNNSRTNKFYDRNGFIFQTSKDFNSATRRMYFPINIYREINHMQVKTTF